jgi:putative two-component system response regulator
MDKTIFVIDDNGSNLSLAEEALEDQYRVITFSSSAKMFAVLGKVMPDLILLDIEMPEMDGFETIKQIKANDLHSKIPVVFMTATADADNEKRGAELGAADFILKPFSAAELQDCVKKYIHSAG